MTDIIKYFSQNNFAELIGLLGSFIVIIAYSCSGEKKIRVLCIISSLIGFLYNILVASPCFAIMNLIIVLINFFYILSSRKQINIKK
ncbi:MAG: YgjV family protein [Clostridiales bacterium]|nr:YgjV family protein [Clostridiales bacterium]